MCINIKSGKFNSRSVIAFLIFILFSSACNIVTAQILSKKGVKANVNTIKSAPTTNPPIGWRTATSYLGTQEGGINPFASRGYGGQCTAFAWGRANEVLGITSLPGRGDAKTWYNGNHSFEKGSTPRANSIAVWSGDTNNIHGHVAYVENVIGNDVYISEANVLTFKKTNFGGGYDGIIKQRTISQMTNRGKGVGKIIGYIYLTTQNSNNAPGINRIEPQNLQSGNFNQDVLVYGSNFQPNLQVSVTLPDGQPGPTLQGEQIKQVTDGSFTMKITFGASGSWGIRVINPDNNQSNRFNFSVRAPSTPAPLIDGVSSNLSTGSTNKNVTVFGSNFQQNLKVNTVFPNGQLGPILSGGQISNVSADSFTMSITLGGSGNWTIRVINPDGAQSNPFTFTVQPDNTSLPTISTISPNIGTVSEIDKNLNVSGSNFQPNLRVAVFFPGNIPGPVLSGSQITNTTANSFTMSVTLGTSGLWRFKVINPNGGESSAFDFPVQASSIKPTITGINPSVPTVKEIDQDIIVSGTNFQPNLNVSVVFPGGLQGPTLNGSQILNVTTNSFVIRIKLGTSGIWAIKVNNPDGQPSNLFSFQVNQSDISNPVIAAVSPSAPTASVGNQNITVSGSNFISGLTVTITFPNGQTGILSGSQITSVTSNSFVMVVNFNGNPGSYSIRINNPSGQQSNAFGFTAQAQVVNPSITSISPSTPVATVGNQNVTVNGSNFQSGLTVTITFPNGTTGTLSGSQITNVTSNSFVIVANFNGNPGSYFIRVNNPDGQQSNNFGFNAQAQVVNPSINSVSPSTPVATVGNQNITVSGSNFVSGLTVTITFPNGTTGTLSGAQITNVNSSSFVMIVNFNGNPGSYSIRVNNPGGQQSNAFGFNAQAQVVNPSITSISPSSPTATIGNQNVTVNGSNFQSGLTVTITFPNGTTGTLSGSQITNVSSGSFVMIVNFNGNPGSYSIKVNNPGGQQSNNFGFNVQAQVVNPVINSISPASPSRTPGNQNVTVNGSNFQSGLSVTITFPNGQTGTLSGTQITNVSSGSFVMVVNFNGNPGSYSIRINNPGGQQSNNFGFNVN